MIFFKTTHLMILYKEYIIEEGMWIVQQPDNRIFGGFSSVCCPPLRVASGRVEEVEEGEKHVEETEGNWMVSEPTSSKLLESPS